MGDPPEEENLLEQEEMLVTEALLKYCENGENGAAKMLVSRKEVDALLGNPATREALENAGAHMNMSREVLMKMVGLSDGSYIPLDQFVAKLVQSCGTHA